MERKQEKGIKDQEITASGTGTRVMEEELARRTREQGRAVKQGKDQATRTQGPVTGTGTTDRQDGPLIRNMDKEK
jgi:hypothetical protein